MSAIVGIHGIAQQYKGGAQLRAVWLPALQDGLTAAGDRNKADALSADDLTVSFFGNLFRPKGALGADLPPFTSRDLRSDAEVELLHKFYQAAITQEPDLGPPAGALGPGRVAVQVMVEHLLRSKAFAGLISERAFVGNLKQVSEFLHDENVKQRVLSRVAEEVSADTRLIIGHSLGSIVAYEFLCRYRPPGVKSLLTLGCPLGIRNVVFDQLTPSPINGVGIWPGVGAWVNVADSNDIVALRKDLAPLFPQPAGQIGISDRKVNNGKEPHGISQYLCAAQTGEAVAAIFPDLN